ncbi:isochorismate synthase MenF [Amycolatopsis sp. 195334CR]|uniref:isochorismate synthase n=1 Tax=Amycolatopsis sp. 195334CR TaxID=2814588 RepID=UPI001A8E3154|nr:isochorismate synthase [Amycolatopsis sp. 195334CR]MBN6034815.1 isochorismate synthase [Amycolatopsis sp. 195334CR]
MTATAHEGARVADLLDGYAAGDFFFGTDRHTLLGSGVDGALSEADPVRLAEATTAALADSDVRLAVGILPFDTGPDATSPGHILLPRDVLTSGPAHPAAASLDPVAIGTPRAQRPVPEPAGHVAAVARAVEMLRDERLRKVVLARVLDLDFDEPIRPEAILRNLVRGNPAGFTFATPVPGGATFLGATPELLLSRHGDRVVSHPHAGSAPRSADPRIDAENARRLAESGKDRREHAVVIEDMVEILRPFCTHLRVAPTEVVGTPTMWHLGTTVTGTLADPGITALRLAAALHPTPAVCGTPTEAARRVVGELEPFDRGYYAGAVGWVNDEGDGEWAVAIRSAEAAERSLRLYAGGGIVADSDPEAELAETTAKFETVLRAMGLGHP